MQGIIGMLEQQFGINPSMANMAVNAATKMFLQKSSPEKASGLLSNLPSFLTDSFDDNDKQQFTTTQVNMTREDLMSKLSEITGIQEKDRLEQLQDSVLDSIRKNSNPQSESLMDAMKDLYKGQFSKF